MAAPSISVVIPTFRRPTQLKAAIQSLLVQTGIDPTTYEIVIVDNCPEGSAHWIANAFPGHFPVIRYAHEAVKGYAHARNRAVAEARGEFLAFLDDDETAEPDWLSQLMGVIREDEADAAFGPVKAVYAREFEPDRAHLDLIFSRQLRLERGADLAANHMRLGTGNSVFRMATCFGEEPAFSAARDVGGGEDSLFIRNLVAQRRRLVWAPNAVVNEHVPAERCHLPQLRARRHQQGKMRTLTCWAAGRTNYAAIAFWMAAGAAQWIWFSVKAGLLRLTGQTHLADMNAVRAAGGWGKIVWWTSDVPVSGGDAQASGGVGSLAARKAANTKF